MNIEHKPIINRRSLLINRFLYGTMVLLGLYFLVIRKDPASAMSNLGIALAFDPFDQNVAWRVRPLYQRGWLVVHVAVVIILLVFIACDIF